ncbi:small ubiquitin-related modifier 1-like [Typha latifolia]|uniref:small ubiquitin-related modifier 1-like n=1 Tax=Typha latifolia TaxID=4733 RepID=UPI003C2B4F04
MARDLSLVKKVDLDAGRQEKDEKPADKSTHVNIKITGQDGNDLYLRINRSAQLRNLMNVYCKRQSLDFNSISFLLDGRKLHWDQTPDEVGMEDGDEIEVL